MDGFLVIDKPAGMTSHAVVSAVRRITGQRKAGHTGTLDPFATGVLPVALGEGTKAIPFLDESIKEYRAVMRLGVATDTQDCTGRPLREGDWCRITPADVAEGLRQFTGPIMQVPPMFSALKRDGVPLYRLARQGREVEREARPVRIYSLAVEGIDLPCVAFTVRCSRGTYVRTLASDLGEWLGCGAHLVELRRTMSGPFAAESALTLDELARLTEDGRLAEAIVSPYRALAHLVDLHLTDAGAGKVARGIAPAPGELQSPPANLKGGERVRLAAGERLTAVAENLAEPWSEDGKNLRIVRVFNQL